MQWLLGEQIQDTELQGHSRLSSLHMHMRYVYTVPIPGDLVKRPWVGGCKMRSKEGAGKSGAVGEGTLGWALKREGCRMIRS
jgi:hypothetical protein